MPKPKRRHADKLWRGRDTMRKDLRSMAWLCGIRDEFGRSEEGHACHFDGERHEIVCLHFM